MRRQRLPERFHCVKQLKNVFIIDHKHPELVPVPEHAEDAALGRYQGGGGVEGDPLQHGAPGPGDQAEMRGVLGSHELPVLVQYPAKVLGG